MEPLAVTIPETGRVMSLGKTKIYELVQSGELCCLKIGRKSLITTESIRALLKRSQSNCATDSS
jgi:excisionase family DNA binding protein